ncbi:DNA-3-methyladenine glycosylase 2 [Pigmentiphaga aceris]|uniref:DNA-3-methyladenine glycosylase II n=1 Tax=Pigmentiphaga aceris TaxID=1940612 RepID=A0A5C0B1V2_9BURK|nr:DNA-3-methyladenine glycosylase 2 [Pigmentiphaga aceris]QEI07864.1 DNA-3-methyladenine glycosylase 2 [Pigmentiphaga aceris]
MFDFTLPLPRGYIVADILNFHARDKDALSEIVSDTPITKQIKKAVLLGDVPTVIDIALDTSLEQACCVALSDAPINIAMQSQAKHIAASMLGLHIDPAAFLAFVETDPVFGPLTARQQGLRIAQSASIFEALTWAIMGQQINVAFAVSLRRSFIRLAGQPHSSGLICYPSPADAARIDIEALTSRQFSRAKAETLLRLADLLASGQIDLQESPANSLDTICAALLAVKGIGPWTVNYALLRGYGYADCSLHGDVAVRAAIANLWGHETRPSIAAAETLLARYRPHRTMAAAHLWASLNKSSNY